MLNFLFSPDRKRRKEAERWLEEADRVYKFQRDRISPVQTERFQDAVARVRGRLKERADAGELQRAVQALDAAMREIGGKSYPASSLAHNVEFFLFAAIVVLGARAYFVQPFKIPTNSMWPSYHGMTAEVFPPGEEPGAARRLVRWAAFGARNYTVTAPTSGELMIPVLGNLQLVSTKKAGRSMGIFPTRFREYYFRVGTSVETLTVPADFQGDFEMLLNDALKGASPDLISALRESAARTPRPASSTVTVQIDGKMVSQDVYWLPIGKQVTRGSPVLSFDILTGDMLLVERVSYNFVPPKVGSGFVFKTTHIEDYRRQGSDIYMVKRLVGTPGDSLEIKPPVLHRNGAPITGAAAFGKNAERDGNYSGYTTVGGANWGDGAEVPADHFFAMGDNSSRSHDSRAWGFVPEKDVVGRPMFILYPLSRRWGPTYWK